MYVCIYINVHIYVYISTKCANVVQKGMYNCTYTVRILYSFTLCSTLFHAHKVRIHMPRTHLNTREPHP